MNKNNMIIILLIVIIIILLGSILLLTTNHEKVESKITVTSNSTLYNNETFSIHLSDLKNNSIANQNINVTIISENGDSKSNIINTNNNGDANLELTNLTSGNYTINISYSGNDNYTSSNITQKIEIKEKKVEQTTPTSSSSSSKSNDDSYWETSPDADFEYHTEYYSDGNFRQYDRSGRLVGSTYDEDQYEVGSNVGFRI